MIDEAQHATEEHLAAVSPTLLANANPQLNALGTSALAGKSDWWWGIRRRALSEDPGSFGYVGHTAEVVSIEDGKVRQEPVDYSDRDLWQSTNPATIRRPDVMGSSRSSTGISAPNRSAVNTSAWGSATGRAR